MTDPRLRFYVWAKSSGNETPPPTLMAAFLHKEEAADYARRIFDGESPAAWFDGSNLPAWVAVLDGPAGDAVFALNDRSNNAS